MKYICDIRLCKDGEIELSSCDCPVGQSNNAHCKHIVIVLIALLKWRIDKSAILATTCTENLQTFHKPKSKYTGSPVKADKFKKVIKGHKRNKIIANLKIDFSEHFKISYKDYFQNVIIARGFNNNMSIKQISKPANTYAVEWDHGFYTQQSNEYKILKSLGLIDLSEEDAQKIEFQTMDQSNSRLWLSKRCIRLTASIFHSCCVKVDNEEGATSLVQTILNPVKFTSKATNHGKIYEDVAVKKLNELNHNSLNIKECGLFVPIERPYLGATPDRLLAQESVIEVKCPYSIRHTVINEKVLPYLQRNCDGNLELKEEHPYYYQIQGQLYATKRKFCDFIVYTFQDFKRISVVRNDIFIEKMLTILDKFYDKYLKPAILEKYLYKNYKAVY